MEVVLSYGIKDWQRFQSYLEKKAASNAKPSWDGIWINVLIWAAIGAGTVWFVKRYATHFHWPTAVVVGAVFIVLTVLFIRHLNKLKGYFSPSEDGCFIGTYRINVNEVGIETRGNGYSGHYAWSVIRSVEREGGVIMLFIDSANALIFPEDRLEDPDGFYKLVKECNK